MKGTVLCIIMVYGLSWGNTTKRNELMLKKHVIAITAKSFSYYDLQVTSGIIQNINEIVGRPANKKDWSVEQNTPTEKKSEVIFKPQPFT